MRTKLELFMDKDPRKCLTNTNDWITLKSQKDNHFAVKTASIAYTADNEYTLLIHYVDQYCYN